MASTLNDHVAAEIRAELARQRRSARKLAAELKWTVPYMSRRMTGEIPLDMDDIEAIAAALNVPLAALLPQEAEAPGGPA